MKTTMLSIRQKRTTSSIAGETDKGPRRSSADAFEKCKCGIRDAKIAKSPLTARAIAPACSRSKEHLEGVTRIPKSKVLEAEATGSPLSHILVERRLPDAFFFNGDISAQAFVNVPYRSRPSLLIATLRNIGASAYALGKITRTILDAGYRLVERMGSSRAFVRVELD